MTTAGLTWSMRKLALNCGLVIASTFFALGILELVLRVAGFSYPSFHTLDPVTGSWHVRNMSGWWRNEGEVVVSINADGLRDRDHSFMAAPGIYRIAVLGDSYAAAFQVPLEKTFWHLLQRTLDDCNAIGDRRVEIINFGVAGFGTAQELLALRNRVWRYEPDMVLLAFLTGNDIRNNSRELEPQKNRPFFFRTEAGLVLDSSFTSTDEFKTKTGLLWTTAKQLSNHSRVIQLAYYLRTMLLIRNVPRSPGEAGLDDDVYLGPPWNAAWEEAWRITEELLAQMKKEVEAKGKRFVLVTLSNSIQVHPDRAMRLQFASKLGVADLYSPDRRIEAHARTIGAEYLILAPKLMAIAEANGEFIHGFSNAALGKGHWNEAGNRYAAGLISKALCERALSGHIDLGQHQMKRLLRRPPPYTTFTVVRRGRSG